VLLFFKKFFFQVFFQSLL